LSHLLSGPRREKRVGSRDEELPGIRLAGIIEAATMGFGPILTTECAIISYEKKRHRGEPMQPITILVVDDETEIADLLEVYLTAEGYGVVKASTAQQALSLLEERTFELVLLDVMMPGMDGFSACQEIRRRMNVPIIILSARSEDIDKVVGLSSGADDYLTKPFNRMELIARVKSQLRRYLYLNTPPKQQQDVTTLHIDGLEINPVEHSVMLYGQPVTLTHIEFEILYLLAANRGRVFSAEELFERIWKEKYLQSNNTVMVHIRKIREKIEENPRTPKFIVTVWGVGYKFAKSDR
jgi:two-component system response regulator VanR